MTHAEHGASETTRPTLHRCAGEHCPGLPWKASDRPHPSTCCTGLAPGQDHGEHHLDAAPIEPKAFDRAGWMRALFRTFAVMRDMTGRDRVVADRMVSKLFIGTAPSDEAIRWAGGYVLGYLTCRYEASLSPRNDALDSCYQTLDHLARGMVFP